MYYRAMHICEAQNLSIPLSFNLKMDPLYRKKEKI
jgi:hypothetical protein